jgi:hypothetical protein
MKILFFVTFFALTVIGAPGDEVKLCKKHGAFAKKNYTDLQDTPAYGDSHNHSWYESERVLVDNRLWNEEDNCEVTICQDIFLDPKCFSSLCTEIN